MECRKNYEEQAYNENTKCFGLARVGYSNQKIVSGPLSRFLTEDMGPPLHSFVICAENLHSLEE
jgi:diphthine synthase